MVLVFNSEETNGRISLFRNVKRQIQPNVTSKCLLVLWQFWSFCTNFLQLRHFVDVVWNYLTCLAVKVISKMHSPSKSVMKTHSCSFCSISVPERLSHCCISSSLHIFVLYSGTFRDITAMWFPNALDDERFSCDTWFKKSYFWIHCDSYFVVFWSQQNTLTGLQQLGSENLNECVV